MTRNHFLRFISSFFLTFLFPISVFAWNALGHMVIANIAYENLKPGVQNKVENLIGYFKNEYQDMGSFMQMAYWPDAIRSQRIEMFTHWHYVDVAFSKDGTALKNLVDSDNALWALGHVINVVKYKQANNYERARFLGFMIHIVGDLHQPLHTVSLISATRAGGDKGGNLYHVRYQNDKTNLHHVWDSGVGFLTAKPTAETAKNLTRTVVALYPKKYFSDKIVNDVNPDHWVEEGMVNAKNYVYNTPEDADVSQEYTDRGKKVVQEELALAGYRLAALLNQILV